jgi:WhiB family redox-sensing transcriptional regulator
VSVLNDDPRFAPSRYVEHGINRANDGCPCDSCRWLRAERRRQHRGRAHPPARIDFSWQDDAACKGKPAAWFFDDHGTYRQLDQARALCARCPVAQACLAHAFEHGEVGLWGGTTTDERAFLRRATRTWHRKARS